MALSNAWLSTTAPRDVLIRVDQDGAGVFTVEILEARGMEWAFEEITCCLKNLFGPLNFAIEGMAGNMRSSDSDVVQEFPTNIGLMFPHIQNWWWQRFFLDSLEQGLGIDNCST